MCLFEPLGPGRCRALCQGSATAAPRIGPYQGAYDGPQYQRISGAVVACLDNYDPGRVDAQGIPRMSAGRARVVRPPDEPPIGTGDGYRQRRGRSIGWCSATGRTMAMCLRGVAVAERGAAARRRWELGCGEGGSRIDEPSYSVRGDGRR